MMPFEPDEGETPTDMEDLPAELQAVADRLTCLGMEMADHIRSVNERFGNPAENNYERKNQ